MLNFIFKSRYRIELLLLLFLSLITILLIGDFKVRLANTPSDDSPVVYAYFLQNPEKFSGDIRSVYGRTLGLATIQNWLPALLLRTVKLPPEIPTWIFIYLQNVLLGFAMLRFTRQITGRGDIAWLTVFFTYSAQPWSWNLGNFGSSMTTTYRGHLALPFIIFAASALIEERFFQGELWLILSSLIHLILTLHMVLFIGIFWFWQYAFKERQKFLRLLLLLGIFVAICVIPAMLLRPSVLDRLTNSESMAAIRHNMHAFPWRYSPAWFRATPTFFGFMFLVILAFRHKKAFTSRFVKFWISSFVASVLLAFLHFGAIFFKVPLLLRLITLRATILLTIFSLPLAMVYVTDKLNSDWFLMRWVAATFLIVFALSGFGVLWGCLLVMLFGDLAEGHLSWLKYNPTASSIRRFYLTSWVVFISWSTVILIKNLNTIGFLMPQSFIARRHIVGALVAGAIVGFSRKVYGHLTQISRRPFPIFIMIILLMGITTFKALRTGLETASTTFARANYEAQAWARKNTAEDAIFINYSGSWRTVSRRKLIVPRATGDGIYNNDRISKGLDDEFVAFYGLETKYQKLSIYEFNKAQLSAYQSLDETGILHLARHFGGDYIVRLADEPLGFPEVYRNNHLIIYKIPK